MEVYRMAGRAPEEEAGTIRRRRLMCNSRPLGSRLPVNYMGPDTPHCASSVDEPVLVCESLRSGNPKVTNLRTGAGDNLIHELE